MRGVVVVIAGFEVRKELQEGFWIGDIARSATRWWSVGLADFVGELFQLVGQRLVLDAFVPVAALERGALTRTLSETCCSEK
jgi:hypothetical protein